MPSHSVLAQWLTPAPSLQFDFTSCQGVIFVLLMTLFFSGLILAILLPFQYVSPRVSQWGPWGGRESPTSPKGAVSSSPSREGPEPKAHSLSSCPALLAPALSWLAV